MSLGDSLIDTIDELSDNDLDEMKAMVDFQLNKRQQVKTARQQCEDYPEAIIGEDAEGAKAAAKLVEQLCWQGDLPKMLWWLTLDHLYELRKYVNSRIIELDA